MKKMKIEKQLIFADHVHKVVSLAVEESLTYKHEEDGIRAMGPLSIQGQYEGDDGIEDFFETLEMDVLAPQEKLNGEKFYLEIADYQGIASEDGIQIYVTLYIHGLKETNKQSVEPVNVPVEPVAEPLTSTPVMAPIKEYPKPEPVLAKEEIQVIEQVNVQHPSESTSEDQGNSTTVNEFEDLFPDAESTYTSYRIIVAKPNDTYTGIAQRYDVDETALRDTNKNKEILPKTLVILPFQQN